MRTPGGTRESEDINPGEAPRNWLGKKAKEKEGGGAWRLSWAVTGTVPVLRFAKEGSLLRLWKGNGVRLDVVMITSSENSLKLKESLGQLYRAEPSI